MDNELNYEELLHLAAYSVNNSDLATALNLCKKVDINAVPDQRLNLIHAAILNQLGLHRESIDLYKLVIENEPENELARFQLGVAYFFSNDLEGAETYWDKLDYFAHFAEGLIAAKEGKFDEAIKHLALFIANNDLYPALNNDAGNLLKAFEEKLEKDKVLGSQDNVTEIATKEPEASESLQEPVDQKPATPDVAALLSIYKE
ncbi:hypothetical protein RN22_01450 [Grimontia sp. AD028]|uniref:tetratricopeptide repeat protein n=1 Tax=Grimontia sp. AD028 TaxID=1581149 RepID=UPI00061B14E3|nr:hypothetical protein [Grimontia sp. AD028]KKD62298.1 hypothetical protein RN22_01450 [Grimontia sp. AD028]